MSYPPTVNMAQIRGTAGYNLGNSQPRFSVGQNYSNMKAEATNDPSPLDAIRQQTSKIEDWLDTLSEPVKPYVLCKKEGRISL
jgi:ER-derived vesicles protein